MFTFSRGLTDKFVSKLNGEYEAGGWWKDIVDNKELFVAIRDEYINVYWNGCSLLKLWMAGNDLIGETHYKYLLDPDMKKPYIKIRDGIACFDSEPAMFVTNIKDVGNWKKAAKVYAGDEKMGVHNVILKNSNVFDVEIAFGTQTDENSGSGGADRIDFAALRSDGSKAFISFYEAKMFSNKALRTSTEEIPVLQQIEKYQGYLQKHRDGLIESYRKVCGNLAALEGVNIRYSSVLSLMKDVYNGNVCIELDPNVYLAVFGYDGDQKNGVIWQEHRQKLELGLEKIGSRLILKGNSKELKKGIST